MENNQNDLLVDIHIPFCNGHCVYCTEKSYGENVGYLQRYSLAVEKELASAEEELADYKIRAVHIRCCSLSLLGLQALDDCLGRLEKHLPTDPDTRFIVDLQPQELTEEMLYVLCDRHSINAIRLELMALHQKALLQLHTPFTENLTRFALSFLKKERETKHAFSLSVSIGIGIPGQTAEDLENTLREVLAVKPEQILLKRFRNRRLSREEQLTLAEETDWASFIRCAEAILAPAGLLRAGNSLTFALPGALFSSDDPEAAGKNRYGFGLGAKTVLDGFSYRNTDDYSLYLEHPDDPEQLAKEK